MQNKEELLNAIDAAQSASAKHQVFSDLCDFFKKYRRKVDSQLSDITRKHEKAKASGRSDMEILRMSTRRSQLQCQMIEALKLESEFLDRKIKAGEELIAAQNHFIDLRTREDNTNEEGKDDLVSGA